MEVRLKDVIISADKVLTEKDKAFFEHQVSMIVAYLASSPRLKMLHHILSAEMGVTLAKLSLFEGDMKGGENGKSGGV